MKKLKIRIWIQTSEVTVNPYAPRPLLNFAIFSILLVTSAIINLAEGFKIRFASLIKSSTCSAIKERQNTAKSTELSSNGVFRISHAVTLKKITNFWKSVLRNPKNYLWLCFIISKEWTLCFTSSANFASPQPKSATIWFFGARALMCFMIRSTGLTGHFLTWAENPEVFFYISNIDLSI